MVCDEEVMILVVSENHVEIILWAEMGEINILG